MTASGRPGDGMGGTLAKDLMRTDPRANACLALPWGQAWFQRRPQEPALSGQGKFESCLALAPALYSRTLDSKGQSWRSYVAMKCLCAWRRPLFYLVCKRQRAEQAVSGAHCPAVI